jgi:phosphoribosyl 1,2-cyclic phosphate phosphodiesterase
MHVTILGCGGSSGVPMATGDWGACDPRNPRNRRRRVSILLESAGGARVLVDASPDMLIIATASTTCVR